MTEQDIQLPQILIFSERKTTSPSGLPELQQRPSETTSAPHASQVTLRNPLTCSLLIFAFSHYTLLAERPVQPHANEASALYLLGNNYAKRGFFYVIFYFHYRSEVYRPMTHQKQNTPLQFTESPGCVRCLPYIFTHGPLNKSV